MLCKVTNALRFGIDNIPYGFGQYQTSSELHWSDRPEMGLLSHAQNAVRWLACTQNKANESEVPTVEEFLCPRCYLSCCIQKIVKVPPYPRIRLRAQISALYPPRSRSGWNSQKIVGLTCIAFEVSRYPGLHLPLGSCFSVCKSTYSMIYILKHNYVVWGYFAGKPRLLLVPTYLSAAVLIVTTTLNIFSASTA